MSTCPAVLYLAVRDAAGRTTTPGAVIPCRLETGHVDRGGKRHKGNHPGNGGLVIWYDDTPATTPRRGPGRPRKSSDPAP